MRNAGVHGQAHESKRATSLLSQESTVDIRFEEQHGIYRIMQEERQIGVAREQSDGNYGYSLFGTPHMGSEKSMDDVEKAVRRHVS